jgi:hypothetical protein
MWRDNYGQAQEGMGRFRDCSCHVFSHDASQLASSSVAGATVPAATRVTTHAESKAQAIPVEHDGGVLKESDVSILTFLLLPAYEWCLRSLLDVSDISLVRLKPNPNNPNLALPNHSRPRLQRMPSLEAH